jgi:hypothetical protein
MVHELWSEAWGDFVSSGVYAEPYLMARVEAPTFDDACASFAAEYNRGITKPVGCGVYSDHIRKYGNTWCHVGLRLCPTRDEAASRMSAGGRWTPRGG